MTVPPNNLAKPKMYKKTLCRDPSPKKKIFQLAKDNDAISTHNLSKKFWLLIAYIVFVLY